MKPIQKPIPTAFAPETRFSVRTLHRPFAREDENDSLNRLKTKLLHRMKAKNRHVHAEAYLVRAAQEAESMAWKAGYPLLLLPLLMEEKAVNARKQAQRQMEIRTRSESLLGKAA